MRGRAAGKNALGIDFTAQVWRDNLDENLVSRWKDDRGILVAKQAGRAS